MIYTHTGGDATGGEEEEVTVSCHASHPYGGRKGLVSGDRVSMPSVVMCVGEVGQWGQGRWVVMGGGGGGGV